MRDLHLMDVIFVTRNLTESPPFRYAVAAQKGFETMLVVDNIPVVDDSKKQRLLERLRQTFAKVGAPIEVESIDMPWNAANGTNKGYRIVNSYFVIAVDFSFPIVSFS